MAIILGEVHSLPDHLRRIMDNINTLPAAEFVELPPSELDTVLSELAVRIKNFVSVLGVYDFSAPYYEGALYYLTKDIEDMVYQVTYSDRLAVRNAINLIINSL